MSASTHSPSLRLNVVANYAGKLWSIASVYVFIPIYIRLLGIDAYGLIAFYAVALAIIYIADAGLSASFSREVARRHDGVELANLLRSIETVLFAILAIAAAGMALGAESIASHWLNTGHNVSIEITRDCLVLMAIAVVPQIAMSLYFGGLMGMQKQVRANALYTLFSVVRSGLVVLPLLLVADRRVFFAWQALTAWGFMFAMRRSLVVQLGAAGHKPSFSLTTLQPIYRYASGMFLMSIIAGLNTQLDRLVVSKMRPIEEFAYYALAATLAQIPTIVTMPIATALLPRFTRLVETNAQHELSALYEFNTHLIATLASAAAFWLFFFADDVARLWTSSTQLPPDLSNVIRALAIGGLMLALQLMPFQLSLANGHTRTNVQLGVVFLAVAVPSQYLLTKHFGLFGASIPWLVLNTTAFVFLGIVLNQRFHEGAVLRWFFRFTLPPVLIGFGMLYASRLIADAMSAGSLVACTWGAVGGLLAIALSVLLIRGRHRSMAPHAPLTP